MGSFKGNGRGENPKRRTDDARRRRQGRPDLESLEQRRMLSGIGGPPTWHPTNGNLADPQNGPLANLGPDVVKVYNEYLAFEIEGAKGTFTSSLASKDMIHGSTIGINIRGYGDFSTYENALISLGMTVVSTVPAYDYVEGYIPISKLPQAAEEAQTVGGAAMGRPVFYQKGLSPNQSDLGVNAAAARTAYNVDGTGQKIGVISNSVNDFGGGLASSVASGDLPNNVQVIQDYPAGGAAGASTDEGRAMLEQIYDIAPGASLAFATSALGEANFASNIQALYAAGATTIVDDVHYGDEPFYQDGIIQQAVNTVVGKGATYLSSAGNEGDSGYESTFRGVNASVGTLGAGVYQNFDPTGATTTTQLGINVYQAGGIAFQFDQPFYTSNGVTSNVEIDVLDQAGNIVQQANANNVAMQQPLQITGDLQPGLYNVVIKVDSGPSPNHVVFFEAGEGGFSVDHKFGSAGPTYYPSTSGHNSGGQTISVGAVPYYGTPAFVHTPALDTNEPFSSTGPVLNLFNPDGSPATPTLLLKPDISAPDANNTTFFIPGNPINTTLVNFPANPPYPGNAPTTFSDPTTPTNDSVPTLNNFTGTSSAAPNLAAVVALMKQSNPTLTRNEIITDLDSTARTLNGIPGGTWSPQAGYGLADALAAINAAQFLKVTFISPGANQTVGAVPSVITVFFSQPVNLSTVSAADLKVTGPAGTTITVGTPFGVDSPTFPTSVSFPITVTTALGKVANGQYMDTFVPGAIVSESGTPLTGVVNDRFNIAQLQGPRVVSTAFVGRIVNVTFSEPLNPATVNAGNVLLFRNNGVNQPNFNTNSILVSLLPGAIFSYNPTTFTVTLDLTGVPQSSLPTDHYGLLALNTILDAVGNPLNGQFTGVFPSGTNPPSLSGSNFFQDLGVVQVQPPLISYLALAPSSDSGILGDNNTNITTPGLVGQVTAKFPGTVSGLLVYAEFNGISHPGLATGGLNLAVGQGGRGFIGTYDVVTTTNALGQFTINYPAGVTPLPEGENRVRVLVVGQPDQPPFAGFASSQDLAFRIDLSDPYVGSPPAGGPPSSIPEGANINSLSTLTLNIIDPVNPQTIGSPFAVDPKLAIPALNPTLADNVANYRLLLVTGPNTTSDKSNFITSANFISTSSRVLSSDPYTGQIVLTFAPGLPAGSYKFFALSSIVGSGLTDAAGNPFAGYQVASQNNTPVHYLLDFNLQPTPTYITNYAAFSPDATSPTGFVYSDARASYELPVSGVTPRAAAPATMFVLDFSNPLASVDSAGNPIDYTNRLLLVRSADTSTSLPDGNFGDLGITNTAGFTRVNGISVTLGNSVPGAVFGQIGYNNRLLITLPPGLTLPADYYRIYMPNNGPTQITDIYGNQLDGEFLGYHNAVGKYVDQLQTGQVRGSGANELPDLSGDGTPGGAFVTGFVVVPNGNIIYAQADAIYNPQIPSQTPNGSAALPYPVLAPEATYTTANGGDLNSVVNSGANFVTTFDRSGDGQFEPSAFYAAQQRVQANGGPVVIIAQQSVPTRDPNTGQSIQKPFVLEAPSPSGLQVATIANDASAAVPALTTLVLEQGTILKLQNAALLIQNQGSALQVLGGPNSYQSVTITSYKDSSVGGVSNGDPTTVPSPGDYGGVLFRNFSQAAIAGGAARSSLFPGQIALTGIASVDNRLKGQFANQADPTSQVDAISGADDVMSYVNFLTEKFAGGAVPVTVGVRYDGITLQNSRPTIVNSIIANSGGAGSAQAGLSVDVNALRADDIAQGPLLRADTFLNDGLNGIYIRAEVSSGLAEPSDAILYPNNPTVNGGSANYVLNDPYPYLLTSRLVVGSALVEESGGAQSAPTDRLYIDPGMLVKFELGAGILVHGNGSLNVGDQTYIKHFDADHTYGPTFATLLPNGKPNPLAGQTNTNFVTNSAGLAQVLFTSLNDDTAFTSYFDPIAQTTTTVVQPLPAVPGGSGVLQPSANNVPAAARWGGVTLEAGSVDVINSADFRYGGGVINTAAGSATQHVLEINPGDNIGANIMVTNNVFTDNLDAPINMSANALEAGDPSRPLQSGDPFLHGNIFQRNALNGVLVTGGTEGLNIPNLTTNSVWTGGDFTYILRDTIVLGSGNRGGIFGNGVPNVPIAAVNTLLPELQPNITLTLQSTLPGTILADGTTVAAPGVPLIIKLTNNGNNPPAEAAGANPGASIPNSYNGGAGFIVGVDNGVDPTADSLIDPGAFSQIRILGIGGNQTTGQTRIPVIITSIHDSTVGTTVNNVTMNQVITNDLQAPAAGDGGVIYFGGNSLTDYSLQDPRDGSLIDNADIKYITRIEQQGGGIIYGYDLTASNAYTPSYATKLGTSLGGNLGFADQYNQAKQVTVSNSNLSTFSDVGFRAHPGYGAITVAQNYTGGTQRQATMGEATHTYFVNDTFANMPTGAEIISETVNNSSEPSPAEAVFLNDTFYNDGQGVHTFAPVFNGLNSLSHVATLEMDSIFSNITGTAIQQDGQNYGSQIQYNTFYANGKNFGFTSNDGGVTNDQPILGNPNFRDPANGNFFLLPTSAAIDIARSELGPSIFGDMIYPAVTIDPANLTALPVRNEPGQANGLAAGDINPAGGLGNAPFSVDIVTLPGEPVAGTTSGVAQRPFPDQWIPVLVSSGIGTGATAANAGTYLYTPIVGERDQVGNLRVKDPNSPNVGFGSRPFFDDGAFEYIIQSPPVVDAVDATTGATVTNIYGVGTIAGTNTLPQSIQIKFNERLNPNTITGSSVILLASGGDGIFGNANSTGDRAISLAGKLSFNPTTDILTIDTSGIFTSTALANDEYRIILKGTGSSVIRDNNGLALDGLNLANGVQLPLPSGADQFPGSDFQVTFTIDTNPPAVIAGTFRLDPASDSSGGLNITNVTLPTFDGSIIDVFPPASFLQGQTVHIDVSTTGSPFNFNLIDAGVGFTDVNGNFRVTLTKPIPNTPQPINGPNGIQGSTGSIYTLVRVRVVDQAGNVSNLLTDPYQTYLNEGAALPIQVDTVHPRVSGFTPLANTVATANANGQIVFTTTFTKNIKTTTLNANSVLVERSGGTGSFTTPVPVPILPGSFTETYLTGPTNLGYEVVTFAVAAPLPNDQYLVILKGTGATPITDIAGNALDGSGTGTGSDFTSGGLVVFQPSQSHLIYVQAPSFPAPVVNGTLGTRENPFPTIAAGMNAALLGDDVLVLPGTYKEDVIVKPGVRLLSAALTSTDTSFLPGTPYSTLIYGVLASGKPLTVAGNSIVTVSILGAIPGIPTEVRGFAIISPLVGNSVTGTIDPTNVGIVAFNSNALIDRNIIVNAGLGVSLATSGVNAQTSVVSGNIIAGNINGVGITDLGQTVSMQQPFYIFNNDIVDNTTGLYNISSVPNPNSGNGFGFQAYVQNNIFFSNHDLTLARSGTGIYSYANNTLAVGTNLFYANGTSNTNPATNAVGSFVYAPGVVFNPLALSSNPDILGNLVGNPYFVQAEDPRPNGDTPAVFFNYSNFDLTSRSVAINAANNTVAPTTDFLYRSPVKIAGHGFPNTGPASIGAFYYLGTSSSAGGGGGIPFGGTGTGTGTGGSIVGNGGTGANGSIGTNFGISIASVPPGSNVSSSVGGGIALGTKQFNVVGTSIPSNGITDPTSGFVTEVGPSYIDVNFSDNVNVSSVSPTDLVLAGSGLNAANPARSTSLAWIDDHAVRFYLTGGYNTSGKVTVTLPAGALTDTDGAALQAYTTTIELPSSVLPSPGSSVSLTNNVNPGTLVALALPVLQPVAASGPVVIPSTAKDHASHHTTKKPAHPSVVKASHETSHASAKSAHHVTPAKVVKTAVKAVVKETKSPVVKVKKTK